MTDYLLSRAGHNAQNRGRGILSEMGFFVNLPRHRVYSSRKSSYASALTNRPAAYLIIVMRNMFPKVLVIVFICLFLGWVIGGHWAANSNTPNSPALPIFRLLLFVAILTGWGILGLLAKRRTGTARQLMTFVLVLSGIPVGSLITGWSLQYGVPTPGIYAAAGLVPRREDMLLPFILVASVGNAISFIAIWYGLDWVWVRKPAIHTPQENNQTTDAHD